ncbi:thermonuclease family protein [Terricaulis sp.]|uniref:thermonuclease family protein n=1 Tax=Terricaulis sp. TaxID=2768686 RepID=UPI00378471EB
MATARSWEIPFVVKALGIGLAIAALLFLAPRPSAHADSELSVLTSAIRVIDGDTIEDQAADVTYRLENIDTPETGPRARCTAERDAGARATARVRMLIASAQSFDIRPTGRIDRYGRTIAFVRVDGADLGETLISQGLARPWRGRREPWCAADGSLLP